MKKYPSISVTLLSIVLIISIIFKSKFIYLAPNLSVSIYIVLYAFTFLILGLVLTKYNFKEAEKALNQSIIFIVVFYLITSILCTIPGNIDSLTADIALRNLFTPYSFMLFGRIIYYFDISIIIILIIYSITHKVFISINDILNSYTNKYLSFGISIFIAFIIDTMFMVPILHIKDIYYSNLQTLDIIKFLTANFMMLIVMSLIMLLSYTIIVYKKKY